MRKESNKKKEEIYDVGKKERRKERRVKSNE